MQRRAFLQMLSGLAISLLVPRAGASPSFTLDDFLKLSTMLTTFPLDSLDRKTAKRFYRKLSSHQRELARQLLRGAMGPAADELTTRILTFWFTKNGFDSLAWKSLNFATPPLTCHGEWWKRPV